MSAAEVRLTRREWMVLETLQVEEPASARDLAKAAPHAITRGQVIDTLDALQELGLVLEGTMDDEPEWELTPWGEEVVGG